MRLGIGILGWNRPYYLIETLRALRDNDLTDCDAHLFQDGAVCRVTGAVRAEARDIEADVAVFRAMLPGGTIHQHEQRVGIAENRLAQLGYLSEHYDLWLALEDDVVVSSQYVALMRNLLEDWAGRDNVGAFSSPLWAEQAVQERLGYHVSERPNGPVSVLATRTPWFAPVLDRFRQYCEVIRPYEYRDGWPEYQTAVRQLFGGQNIVVSSNGALIWAFQASGRRLWGVVSTRAITLGRDGTHMTPEIYQRVGYAAGVVHQHPEELAVPFVDATPL